MRLTYYGHSSFLVETADGTRVILDPYLPGSFDRALRYKPIDEPADVVIATHQHDDHGAVDTIPGNPLVLVHPDSKAVGKLQITGVQVAHDEAGGSKRGRNTIVILDDGDVRAVHLGDLGHLLDQATVDAIGRVDVLMVPVGGFFTIDEKDAAVVVDSLDPRVVIPMHYKTDLVDFPIVPVDGFLKTQADVQESSGSSLEVTSETLPKTRTTIVLAHAR
ncbi:MAG: MBL fold metallo-hydrolase [Actinobacteria bacterium]|nr:MBL fold metallo-hydrolase [Actinomycetota bacterium]